MQSRQQCGRAGQKPSGWAQTLLGSAEAGGVCAEPLPPRRLQPHSLGRENHGCPKRVRGRLEADSGTPTVVKGVCSSGIPFFPPVLLLTWTRGRTQRRTPSPTKRTERTSRTRGCPGRPWGSYWGCPATVGGERGGCLGTERFLPWHGRLQPRLPFAGAAAAEEAAWEGGTPPGTPCSPGALAAAGPCAAELSPTAAPAAGAQGTEPGRLPREVRAGGRGVLSLTGGSLGEYQWGTCRTSCPA